jgi:xanthine/CO dehydrogenase XdhC/CoxF family maturation factor
VSDQFLLTEVQDLCAQQSSVILLRVIAKSLAVKHGVRRFIFHPSNYSVPFVDNEVVAKDISQWLQQFYDSNRICGMSVFTNKQGDVWQIIAERITEKLSLYIFGGGHVGQALALMAVLLGYDVTVVDDRAEFASRSRFPDTRIKLLTSDFANAIDSLTVGTRSAAVIVTRGHQYDEICLSKLLGTEVSYLGMIGSKRRVLSIFNRLKLHGFSPDRLNRVHAPIGLKINAKSPQEIAVAILAEIIAGVNK